MIQTVSGAISANPSLKVLMHEHVACVSNDMLHAFGKRWLDENELIDRAVKILISLKEQYGTDLLVDGTPIDLGRNAKVLKEISEKSGMKIVVSSGLYVYPSMVTLCNDEKDIADIFLEETETGLDNTDIKPGILKCATDNVGITEENERRIGALGRVQAATGLPLYLHSLHQENTVNKALKILTSRGANPEKIVIGHFDDSCSFEYVCDILNQGCYACFDRRRYDTKYTNEVARLLARLHESGYGDRLMIANDTCIYSDFCSKGNKWLSPDRLPDTLGFVFADLKDKFLEYSQSITAYNKMISENPIKLLNV